MQKVSLKEFRGVAAVVGPATVVGLLIAGSSSQQLWWRICMGIFSAVTVAAVAAYILPHLQGLRLRVPWYIPRTSSAGDSSAFPPFSEEEFRICRELSAVGALYRRTKAMQVKITAFLNEMEQDIPNKTRLNDATREFLRFLDRNRERYESEYQDELIKLVMVLRLEYGIMPVGLTDGAILNESILPNSVTPILRGLDEAADKLSQIIAEKASRL